MKPLKNLIILWLTISLLSLGPSTKALEEQTTEQEDQTQTQLEGTAWGALFGSIIGALSGKNKKDRVKKAAIGAVIGAGTGFLLGNEVAKRKEQYANKEQAIATEITHAEQFLKEIQATNQKLTQDIQNYEQQIAQIEQDIRQGKASYVDWYQQQQVMQVRKENAEKLLVQLTQELEISQQLYQDYQQSEDLENLEQWHTKIAQLEQEKSHLESSIEQLTLMSRRL